MKLRFNRHEMAEALSAVASVAAVRTPKEILRCTRIEAKSDVVLLSATDLELGLRCAVTQVEVGQQGEALVNAETFSRIVRECTDEVLTAETKDNNFHLRGAGSHFQIVTHDPAEFPPVETPESPPDFNLDFGQLNRLIEWTLFAAARESTRFAINGVLWEISETKFTMAATDGRRLSVARGVLPNPVARTPLKAIIPPKALSMFSRLTQDAAANVEVRISDNQMVLRVGRAVLSTALVEGHFPDYTRVIPQDCDRLADIHTMELLSALKRAALLTNEESRGVRLAFSDGSLTLSSRAPEQGEATVSMPVRYRGEDVQIGFNPVFLIDVLKVTPTEQVQFAFRDANRPGVFRVGDDYLYVVMPVNLTSA
jgi:DNA polymerase-3 subunit beta